MTNQRRRITSDWVGLQANTPSPTPEPSPEPEPEPQLPPGLLRLLERYLGVEVEIGQLNKQLQDYLRSQDGK